jgi:formate-dependent nitrite reductase membrane component NrfD
MILAEAQHFVREPHWTWYILFYFFLAGLSGGSYLLGTLLRFRGEEPAARLAFYAAFPAVVISPVLLALDLGRPWRFWHMLWNMTPGDMGLNWKYWSPMSVGAWALVLYGGIATLSFVDTLIRDGKLQFLRWVSRPLNGFLGKLFNVVGSVVGLFIAGYTGVLLSVSNQPVWSDTWALGGLFLASGLSGAAALLILLTRMRRTAQESVEGLSRAERFYALLEFLLILVFALTLIPAGTLDEAFGFPWILLWAVAFIGLLPGFGALFPTRMAVTADGAVAVPVARPAVAAPLLVLIGVFALRAAIIFAIQ